MSNVTSTCGMPRGAGGMPSRLNWPSDMLSAAIGRSPCSTWIVTARLVVLSRAEDLALLDRDGRVALDDRRHHAAQRLDAQGQRRHVQQQHVLDLAGQHAALQRRADRHHLVRVDAPVRLLAASACAPAPAPSACGSSRRPARLRRCPPPSAWHRAAPARTGPRQRSSRSSVNCSNFARVSFICRCFGPLASAVMNGRLISVSITLDSSILAFSAASLSRCSAWRSLRRSMPFSFLNSSAT